MSNPNRRAKYLCEFLGTFCLVFFGTGAIVVNQLFPQSLTHVGVSLVFGLVVLAMIYTLGTVSGAHLNPAVTLGFLMARRISKKESAAYIVSQITGALLASGVLRYLFPFSQSLGGTNPSGDLGPSFVLEFLLSFVLMIVIFGVAHDNRAEGLMAGVAIGATITVEALVGGPISGASMNPARSLAPALVSGQLTHLWIYLLAPVAGAICAAKVFPMLQCLPTSSENKTGCC